MRDVVPGNDNGIELVEIEVSPRGSAATVKVRSLRTRATHLTIRVRDGASGDFAVQCAERFCAERGLALVMRARRAA